MEYNTAVSNPMLVGAIALMKAEDTPQHRKMVSNEILKARYISPAAVQPVPVPDANGETKIGPQHSVQIPVLMSSGGKPFFMAFTDMSELKKWRDEDDQQTVTMSFQEYAAMLFKKDAKGNPSPIVGFAINPFGENLIVPKEMVEQYMKVTQPNGNPVSPEQK